MCIIIFNEEDICHLREFLQHTQHQISGRVPCWTCLSWPCNHMVYILTKWGTCIIQLQYVIKLLILIGCWNVISPWSWYSLLVKPQLQLQLLNNINDLMMWDVGVLFSLDMYIMNSVKSQEWSHRGITESPLLEGIKIHQLADFKKFLPNEHKLFGIMLCDLTASGLTYADGHSVQQTYLYTQKAMREWSSNHNYLASWKFTQMPSETWPNKPSSCCTRKEQ